MIGTGILWLGWFGFNAGSAGTMDGHALQAFVSTFLASSAGGLSWLLVERFRDGHFTTLGLASGVVAGLVAITPGCAFVSPLGAVAIGFITGIVCCYAVRIKVRFGYDDSLDVVGVHMVGGLVGSVLIGLFADPLGTGWEVGKGVGLASKGLFYGGGIELLIEQVLANGVAIVYSGAVTALILLGIKATIGLRVDSDEESEGLDATQHAETAYHQGGFSGGRA